MADIFVRLCFVLVSFGIAYHCYHEAVRWWNNKTTKEKNQND